LPPSPAPLLDALPELLDVPPLEPVPPDDAPPLEPDAPLLLVT
jgi:hypothetical protein